MLHSDKTVNAYHVTGERDDLHEKFSSSVLDLQHKSGLKYSVLERKISSLRAELDELLYCEAEPELTEDFDD